MITHINFLRAWLAAHTTNERGASLVEYALLVALIAVVVIGAITLLSGSIEDTFSSVSTELDAANN